MDQTWTNWLHVTSVKKTATQIVLDLYVAQDLAVDFHNLNINGQHCLK